MGINVLSLFDGMSCSQIALSNLGIEVDNYYACEIDKHAMKVTLKNYPNTEFIGDVKELDLTGEHYTDIDLLVAGSPCQGFSFAGKQLNFKDPRSSLFFEFVRILKDANPKYFLLENVKMKKEYQDIISKYLGVGPIEINSALVSAQNRKRLYWTNIPNIEQPKDEKVYLKDILITNGDPICYSTSGRGNGKVEFRMSDNKKAHCLTATGYSNRSFVGVVDELLHSEKAIEYMGRKVKGGRTHWDFKHHSDTENKKSATLVANLHKGVPYNVLKDGHVVRKLHPVECERLQTVPDNYTEGVSNTQRYKMLGNGFTVKVIEHILKNMEID